MPIPWLTVLQAVPWTDVIRNAPKVADGARKLWGSVAGTPAVPEPKVAPTPPQVALDPQAVAALQARIAALENAVSELHGQMLTSSELIKALAEQNTQLVARVETDRLRMRRLTWGLGIVAVFVATGLSWALRHLA